MVDTIEVGTIIIMVTDIDLVTTITMVTVTIMGKDIELNLVVMDIIRIEVNTITVQDTIQTIDIMPTIEIRTIDTTRTIDIVIQTTHITTVTIIIKQKETQEITIIITKEITKRIVKNIRLILLFPHHLTRGSHLAITSKTFPTINPAKVPTI